MENFLALKEALSLLTPPLIFTLFVCFLVGIFYHLVSNLAFLQIIAFFFMAGIFGTSIGCIVGATESGEISTIITAIITLGSGYITYLTSKEKNIDVSIKQLLPGGLTVLLLCMLISLFYMRYYFYPSTT